MVRKISFEGLRRNIGRQVLVWSEGGSVSEGKLSFEDGLFYLKMSDKGNLKLVGKERIGIPYESGAFGLYDIM